MVFVHEVQKKSNLKVPTEEASEAAQILKSGFKSILQQGFTDSKRLPRELFNKWCFKILVLSIH